MSEKYMTNGALLVGPVVRIDNLITGELLGVLPQNRDLFLALAQQYRIRRHEDGWFVDGKGHRTQIWEFGIGKLGLTVTGNITVHKCQRIGAWLHPRSIGDEEANFYCDWTEENLANLTRLVGLQRRRSSVPGTASSASQGPESDEGDENEPE